MENNIENRPTLWDLFWVFAKIGSFTFGGGYAMISLIEDELVAKKGWMTKEDFAESLVIAQSAPGLLAVNISIFTGYRLLKDKGSFVATIGSCLPSFLAILAIALFFAGYRDNVYVERFFKGVRPAVTALIAIPVISMIVKYKLSALSIAVAALIAVLIIFLHISPIYILAVAIFCSVIYNYGKLKKEGKV